MPGGIALVSPANARKLRRVIIKEYKQFGGKHWETAALRNVLEFKGFTSPHTNQPLSEELLLGIGGGIQPGYSFLPAALKSTGGIFIAGRTRSHITGPEYSERMLSRLGASANGHASAGSQGAFRKVLTTLEMGDPSIVYCNKAAMPYLRMPAARGEQVFMHTAVIYGYDEIRDVVLVGDQSEKPLTVSVDEIIEARARSISYKNRSFTVSVPGKFTEASLEKAIREGIGDYLDSTTTPRTRNYSLHGIEEWAKVIGSASHPNSWQSTYRKGLLYRPLVDVFESIEILGGDGGLFRPMYADFLDEAADILKEPEICEVADLYRALGTEWTALADACLPDEIPEFKATKALHRERQRTYLELGDLADDVMKATADRLAALDTHFADGEFPLNPDETEEFLLGLSNRIAGLVLAEWRAIKALGSIW